MTQDNKDQAFMRFLAIALTNKRKTNKGFSKNRRYPLSIGCLTSAPLHQTDSKNAGSKAPPAPPLGARYDKDYSAYWLRLLDHPLHKLAGK